MVLLIHEYIAHSVLVLVTDAVVRGQLLVVGLLIFVLLSFCLLPSYGKVLPVVVAVLLWHCLCHERELVSPTRLGLSLGLVRH